MKAQVEKTYPAYKTGFLKVPHGHNLYYELYGNPKGKPVLFLHGGPGAGFREKHKRFFDPKVWNVILFDQRGAGRSTPFANLYENTTVNLVADINLLLDKLKIERVVLFGGSWGSTLALVYALAHPERVKGMIMWGIFLCNKSDRDYYLGGGSAAFVPEAWERFVSLVPSKYKKDPATFYFRQLNSTNEKAKEKFAYEWAFYESRLINPDASEKTINKLVKDFSYKSLAPLEAHYIINGGFFPENYILKNAANLSGIATVIVQGRYDYCCPPTNAYQLSQKIKGSKLIIVNAGHASSERPLERQLTKALNDFN